MDQLKEGRRLLSKNANEMETMSGTEKGKVSNDLRKCFREANDMMAKLDQLQVRGAKGGSTLVSPSPSLPVSLSLVSCTAGTRTHAN